MSSTYQAVKPTRLPTPSNKAHVSWYVPCVAAADGKPQLSHKPRNTVACMPDFSDAKPQTKTNSYARNL